MKAFIAIIALMTSLTVSANVKNGTVEAQPKGSNIVVSIKNEAAKLIFDQLQNAKEEVTQKGSLTTAVRTGRDVTCYMFAAFITVYSCEFKIDDTGAVVK